jgi:integrase
VDADTLLEGLIALGLSPKTIAVYRYAIARAQRWCAEHELELEELRPSEVLALAESFPHTKSSRAQLRAALSAFYGLAGRPDNPTSAIRVPRRPRMRCRALEDHEAAVLAAVARRREDRPGAAVLLGLYAGLRRAEIAGIRWRQIEPSGWLTLVGKGDVTRSIPLHPVILEALAALPSSSHTVEREGHQGSEFVFPGRWGAPAHPSTIRGWVRAVATEAGLGPISTHILRHTALATSLDATRDLRAVQELAGHARPETTAGYTRVRARRLVETVMAIEYGTEECA